MLKRLTRKLFILFALVAYLTLAVPSTPAQGSGYSLSGFVWHQGWAVSAGPVSGYASIYKWNGSSWVFHGYATASSTLCGEFYYDTGGPGLFLAEVNGTHAVLSFPNCGFGSSTYAYMYGSAVRELSAAHPSASMDINTLSDPF